MGWSILVMDLAILPNSGATEVISRGPEASLCLGELLSTGFLFLGARLLICVDLIGPVEVDVLFGPDLYSELPHFLRSLSSVLKSCMQDKSSAGEALPQYCNWEKTVLPGSLHVTQL